MKKVIIPEEGLDQYSAVSQEKAIHVMTLWEKDYWSKKGRKVEFCEEVRIVPRDTRICYYGHGNKWEDTYTKGQVVCTKNEVSIERCSLGEALLSEEGYSLGLKLKANLGLTEGRLEAVVQKEDSVFTCEGKKKLHLEIVTGD